MPAARSATHAATPASEALAKAREVIEARIAELAPLVAEHEHLCGVLRAMDAGEKPKRRYTRRQPTGEREPVPVS